MPYIAEEQRWTVDDPINDLLEQIDRHGADAAPGIVNYIITRLLLARFGNSYRAYAMAVGVLETCKLEFYRRAVAPYEDKKIHENGDVL